jgi:hypothetical protein
LGLKPDRSRSSRNETGRGGTAAVQARADARAADLAPIVADIQASGATSLRAIAAGLNARLCISWRVIPMIALFEAEGDPDQHGAKQQANRSPNQHIHRATSRL